jgi:hypothetical protein
VDNDGSLEVVINYAYLGNRRIFGEIQTGSSFLSQNDPRVHTMVSRPSLGKDFGTKKNWLLVRAVGVKCNQDAVGARVIGLADDASYQRVEMQWPGGQRQFFPGGKAKQIVILNEGTGLSGESPVICKLAAMTAGLRVAPDPTFPMFSERPNSL